MPRGLPTIVMLLLVVVGLTLGAWWLGRDNNAKNGIADPQQLTAARAIPPLGWGPMHVMTANIRLDEPADGENGWLKRREFLVKTLLKYQPDILGCQEVSPAQGAYLHKELSRWYAYYPRAGVGPSATSGAGGQTRSAAAELLGALSETLASLDTLYYRADRFDIVDGQAGLVLPKEPQANTSENTFFSMAVLKEKRSQAPGAQVSKSETLIVVDIHFRHDEAFAIRCAREMRTKLNGWLAKYPNSGILLMGDINHGRGSQLYATLMTAEPTPTTLADSFDYSKMNTTVANGTYQQFIGRPNAMWPSDLIFSGGALQVSQNAEIVRDRTPEGRYPSDHYFVQAQFDWEK